MKNLVDGLEVIMSNIRKNGLELIVPAQEGVKLRPYEIIGKVYNHEFFNRDLFRETIVCKVRNVPIAEMSLSKGILNAMLLSTLNDFGISYKKEYVFIGNGNKDSQSEYLELLKNDCFNVMGWKIHRVRDLIGNLIEVFAQFAIVLSHKLMYDISMLDFIELCRVDKDIKNWILNGPVSGKMSLEEAQEIKAKTLVHLKNVIKEKDLTPWNSVMDAGVGVRMPQLIDCLFTIGSRPDQSIVLPKVMEMSWLRGITTMDEFFIEAYISRAALIITKLDIKDPGAFQKMISYLNNSNYLNKDMHYMCDSVNCLKYHVTDAKVLSKLHDRYQVLDPSDTTNVRRIDANEDTYLIGQDVYVRSPTTCNSKDGICRYCAGRDIWKDNVVGPLGANSNLGVIFVKRYISPEGQNFLSSKHNMVTNIIGVNFSHNKNVILTVYDANKLKANGKITLPEEFISREKGGRTFYSKFIVNINGLDYEVVSETETNVYVVEGDDTLYIETRNNRKSETYIKIKYIFENTKNIENPIDELNTLLDVPYIVGETLLRNMLYTPKRMKPDWSKPNPEVEWISHKIATLYTSGVVNKFPYGYFKRIISDTRNYQPTAAMPYDKLFANRKKDK